MWIKFSTTIAGYCFCVTVQLCQDRSLLFSLCGRKIAFRSYSPVKPKFIFLDFYFFNIARRDIVDLKTSIFQTMLHGRLENTIYMSHFSWERPSILESFNIDVNRGVRYDENVF